MNDVSSELHGDSPWLTISRHIDHKLLTTTKAIVKLACSSVWAC